MDEILYCLGLFGLLVTGLGMRPRLAKTRFGLGNLGLLFCFLASSLPAQEINWRIIKTEFPTTDVVIAGLSVLEFGADQSGKHDSTEAFQKALDRMGEAGGGTVFVPKGFYRFSGSLNIPISVTLRGEWQAPSETSPTVKGSVLMPTGGQGNPEGRPFITVYPSAGIKDLNIWYPEQRLDDPIPYPYCLIQESGNNATFENLTLVNPYQGIKIGPDFNELHFVRNVYGTPIKTGIWYDSTTDIGRLESINFSPRWWKKSGLPDIPESFQWIRENGTAIFMGRSDWEYVADVDVEGYDCGFHIARGARGAANAQFYKLTLRDCGVAMKVEETNPYGMVFTQCYFEGSEQGVLVQESFNSTIMFSDCVFEGEEALRSNGQGKILMEQCRIDQGKVFVRSGVLTALNPEINNTSTQFELAEQVEGAAFAGAFQWTQVIENKGSDSIIQKIDESPKLNPIPAYPQNLVRAFFPAQQDVLRVVEPSGSDDSASIQDALDRVSELGGGTVFLPAGDYRLKGLLKVPSGVELRGVHDVPHHTAGGGSVLHVFEAGGEPTIVLSEQSGLRGLGFNYPEQRASNIQPFPFLIQGRGSDIYVINVNASNPYQFIDFMTYRCDRHYIDYASGAPLRSGILVGGGSQDGIVMNMQFNPHYWTRTPSSYNPLYAGSPSGGINRRTGAKLWEFQKENLDALVVGDSAGQFLFQNFVFGSLYGMRFVEQDGRGAIDCLVHGHGTDGSKVGVFFEHGEDTITMINSELVAMASEDKIAIKIGPDFGSEALLINTMIWGEPDLLAEVAHGSLILQNMHANRHGDGINLSDGGLRGYNLSFNSPGDYLEAFEGAQVKLVGVVTEGPSALSMAQSDFDLLIKRN